MSVCGVRVSAHVSAHEYKDQFGVLSPTALCHVFQDRVLLNLGLAVLARLAGQ